jgi:hypothetical protein
MRGPAFQDRGMDGWMSKVLHGTGLSFRAASTRRARVSRDKRRSAVPYSGAYEVVQSVVLQKVTELRRTTPCRSRPLPLLSVRFLASAPLRGLPAKTSLR